VIEPWHNHAVIHLVVRSLWEGPTGRRVRHLPATSLLAWFRENWRGASGNSSYLDDLCGGRIYGFHTLFDAAPEPPDGVAELQDRVETHLYVEGESFFDEHALRVITDDDEVDIAYFLFDDSFPRAQTAWMLHETFELPVDARASGDFVPARSVRSLEPRGAGPGATYFVFLTGYDSSTLDLDGPRVLPGVRLPELSEHLRRIQPAATIERKDKSKRPKDPFAAKFWSPIEVSTDWPRELLLLRAQLAAQERDLEGALRACNDYPVHGFGGAIIDDAGLGPLRQAHEQIEVLRAKWTRDASHARRSMFQASEHLVQMSMCLDSDTHHQWLVFDDLWASAHPELANALLEWASAWDVLCPTSAA
jgi:hypothetical protein